MAHKKQKKKVQHKTQNIHLTVATNKHSRVCFQDSNLPWDLRVEVHAVV